MCVSLLGDNADLGSDVYIIWDVKIVSIGAGSVVVKDLPNDSVCVGIPCHKIKDKVNEYD